VQHDDRRFPAGDDPADEREHVEGVANVEVARRFIEEQRARILGDRERDPHALPFAARQFREGASAQTADLGLFDRRVDCCPVRGRRRPAPPGPVREAPPADDVVDQHSFGQRSVGLDERDGPAALPGAQRSDGLAVDPDRARIERPSAGDGPQQRRFSGAVGTDERDELSVGDGQRNVFEYAASAVGQRDAGDFDHAARRRKARKRKIGTPNIESRTPTGRSSGGAIERATASAKTTSIAPTSVLATRV
jgi:hypothetical protein